LPVPESTRSPRDRDDERVRERWFYSQRAYPRRAIPAGALLRARAQAARLPLVVSDASLQGTIAWKPLGPQPIDDATPLINEARENLGVPPWSGRVTEVVPASDDDVFIGTSGGGVWKTGNLGASWTPLFDDQLSLSIGTLAVDPNIPNTLFAGTGEANFSEHSYYGAGIYKSTDDGVTWRRVDRIVGGGTFDDCHIGDIVVTPGDSSRVLVAILGDDGRPGRTECDPRSGIYLSTDGGEQWTLVRSGTVNDLAVVPNSPSVWYAGVAADGIYKSTDGGAQWQALIVGEETEPVGRIELAVSRDGSRIVAAVEEDCDRPQDCDAGSLHNLITSTNAGQDWTPVDAPSDLCDDDQCFHALAVAIDPRDPTTFYLGGVNLFRYQFSDAETFQKIGAGRAGIHIDITSLGFDRANRLWIGNDGGVYRSSDGGETFLNVSADLSISQFYPGIAATRSGGTLLGGLQDNGTVRTTGDLEWTEVMVGDGGYSVIHPTNPNLFIATTPFAELWRTTDGGKNFRFFDLGTQFDLAEFIAPVVMDPVHPKRMFAGTIHLWKSIDAGENWQAEFNDPWTEALSAIGPSSRDPDVTYVGSGTGELYLTSNGGNNWTNVGAGVPDRFVTDLAVSPTMPRVAYLSLSGFGTGHVFRTTNRGGEWTDVSGDLPNSPVNSIAVDWRFDPDRLYAATDVGVFTSGDGGSTWQGYGTKLPNAVVMDVLLQPNLGTVVAATYGRGAFEAPLVSPPPKVTADYRLQNSLESSAGSPPKLRPIGPRQNSFVSDTVDGVSRRVLKFPKGNGVALAPTTDVVQPSAYSIVVLARLDDVSGFTRLLDFTGGTSDRGLYVLHGDLALWPQARGSGGPIKATKYAQIVLTRDVDGTVVGYIDGDEQFTFVDSREDALLARASIRFFADDAESPGESSAGAVARIRLFRGVLNAAQVADLDRV
jgi:photosystem II stability/assembly factor-like uncharacterized protein